MTIKLTKTQLKEMESAFKVVDKDNSGSITMRELGQLFKRLDMNVSDQQIKTIYNNIDVNGDGSIEFTEFVKFMSPHFYGKPDANDLRTAFNHFDRDNNGFITITELQKALAQIDYKYTDEQLERMIKKIDVDGDGKISIEEFIKVME